VFLLNVIDPTLRGQGGKTTEYCVQEALQESEESMTRQFAQTSRTKVEK